MDGRLIDLEKEGTRRMNREDELSEEYYNRTDEQNDMDYGVFCYEEGMTVGEGKVLDWIGSEEFRKLYADHEMDYDLAVKYYYKVN